MPARGRSSTISESRMMASVFPYFDRKHPDFASLRQRAKSRMPKFAYDFVDTGAARETCLARNYAAFDAVELVPRFGGEAADPDLSAALFGETYTMPVGIAPMGLTGLAWPGADRIMASAAQASGIPYCMATGSSLAIENASQIVPDRFWFQLYKTQGNGGRTQDDLIARALHAGAKVLVLTVDSSARPFRPRDMKNGLVPPFSLSLSMAAQASAAPFWMAALAANGVPKFENLLPYIEGARTPFASAAFTVRTVTGAFSWREVAEIRGKWPHALVVKGVTHPDDAKAAVAAGADGVWISNHGGRVFDAAPSTIDMLPEIRSVLGGDIRILLDSGIRDGTDVLRALALGADFCFAGRAFLFAVAALGSQGAVHMATTFFNDITNGLKFLGKRSIGDLGANDLRLTDNSPRTP